jgi:hypothetical protein
LLCSRILGSPINIPFFVMASSSIFSSSTELTIRCRISLGQMKVLIGSSKYYATSPAENGP